eukprot:TRINITY_DN6819_c0_g2_i1.p1 TRINITY_DN6819_c0_g2~~TRINITY_DN6819_c0_g2_i1.p1  ORF type:complete len:343 (+),score=69.99 TRINITY_DN6819_c0_g2_i1:55-1083(+)
MSMLLSAITLSKVILLRSRVASRMSSLRFLSQFPIGSGKVKDESIQENNIEDDEPVATSQQRSLNVAIIGAPNAGKSTLLNSIIGQKVSVVSPKAQTTRKHVLGIWTHRNSQIVFTDTPGMLSKSQRKSLRYDTLSAEPWPAVEENDKVILVVDAAKRLTEDTNEIISRLNEVDDRDRILILNKVDLISEKKQLLAKTEEVLGIVPFTQVFMISARRLKDIQTIKDSLLRMTEARQWLYPPQMLTLSSQEEQISELIREKIYSRFHQELPYSIQQDPPSLRYLNNGDLVIEQTVVVPNKRVKAMVVGSSGAAIRQVSVAARIELRRMLGCEVHLYLNVSAKD